MLGNEAVTLSKLAGGENVCLFISLTSTGLWAEHGVVPNVPLGGPPYPLPISYHDDLILIGPHKHTHKHTS